MFSTRNLLASSLLASSLLAGLAQAEDTAPAGPDWILFGPTDDCTIGSGMELEILWTVALAEPASKTLNLSAEIVVQVGDYTAVETVQVFADPGAGYNPDGGYGAPAGTGLVDGLPVQLVDLSDGSGDYSQFPWIRTRFPAVPDELFDADDVIIVRVTPAPGAEPEVDASNNLAAEPVGDSFYDRGFRSVELVPVPGTMDLFDIVVEYQLAYNTSFPPEDLRTDLVLEHNGETKLFPTWNGPWTTTLLDDCGPGGDELCAVIKSGGETVTTLTSQPWANAFGSFASAFVSEPIRTTIPAVQIQEGDELELFLTHAPGAMPELSGLDDDSWLICSNEAQASPYGQGKPGTFGVPTLGALDLPVLGQASGLRMKEALPGATPVLFLGLAPLNAAFAGGTLLVDPVQVLFLPAPIAADGTVSLPWAVPADVTLCGLSIFSQMMFLDPGAAGPKHIAMTNGLHLVVGQ